MRFPPRTTLDVLDLNIPRRRAEQRTREGFQTLRSVFVKQVSREHRVERERDLDPELLQPSTVELTIVRVALPDLTNQLEEDPQHTFPHVAPRRLRMPERHREARPDRFSGVFEELHGRECDRHDSGVLSELVEPSGLDVERHLIRLAEDLA